MRRKTTTGLSQISFFRNNKLVGFPGQCRVGGESEDPGLLQDPTRTPFVVLCSDLQLQEVNVQIWREGGPTFRHTGLHRRALFPSFAGRPGPVFGGDMHCVCMGPIMQNVARHLNHLSSTLRSAQMGGRWFCTTRREGARAACPLQFFLHGRLNTLYTVLQAQLTVLVVPPCTALCRIGCADHAPRTRRKRLF